MADAVSGWWLTEDGKSIVSIEACAERPRSICGYLIEYESTGDNALDREICRLPILGDLVRDGDKLKGGWLLDPDSEEFYNLVIHPRADGASIQLRIFGKIEAFGETVVWTRTQIRETDCSQ